MQWVGRKLDVPLTQIYHVATFYKAFHLVNWKRRCHGFCEEEPEVLTYKLPCEMSRGIIDLLTWGAFDDYIALGGYSALAKALYEMSPDEVLEEVKRSNLRGRSGVPCCRKKVGGHAKRTWQDKVCHCQRPRREAWGI